MRRLVTGISLLTIYRR